MARVPKLFTVSAPTGYSSASVSRTNISSELDAISAVILIASDLLSAVSPSTSKVVVNFISGVYALPVDSMA